MFGAKTILFFEKLAIVIAIIAVFLFATTFFDQWANPLKEYFFKTGRWEELAIIVVFVLGIGYTLQYLAKLALRAESSSRPGARRRRWR